MMTRGFWLLGIGLAVVGSVTAAEPVCFTGRVLDPAGKPVAGATVAVLPGHDQWEETPLTLPSDRTRV